MQVTKKTKYTILISIFILMFFSGSAQENTDTNSYTDTLITQNDSTKTKHKFSLSGLFKKKNKPDTEENENEDVSDTTGRKQKFSFKNLFKRKNKSDSTISKKDSLQNDSSKQKKRFKLFNRNKNDSSEIKSGTEKPQRITPGVWLKMNASQQDSLLREWDDYDREHFVKKYRPTYNERKRDMKKNKNFIDKLLLKRAVNKPFNYRKKLINRRITRYRKTMIFDRLKKSDSTPDDTISDKKQYQTVNKQFKIGAKQEVIRKNKTILKFDRKEARLRRRYDLSEKEGKILNKGKVIILHGEERIIFNKAKRKQEKFSEKLLLLRRKRSFALQNKEVQKKIKKDKKRIVKRDKKNAKRKRIKKNTNKKHDSSEYPKQYFK